MIQDRRRRKHRRPVAELRRLDAAVTGGDGDDLNGLAGPGFEEVGAYALEHGVPF